MRHRLLVVLAAVLAAVAVVPAALAARVHVRVEGRSQTIFGATEPLLAAAGELTALGALEAASVAGEFYYRVTESSFGPYVSQIGRYPASGTAGWVFKVNGASASVGARDYVLKERDRVLWYWAQFGIVPGGPPTLRLLRERRGCYRVVAEDDSGRDTPALRAVLRVDGRRVRTRGGRACVGPHRGLVRATMAGAVRSNALR